MGEAKEPLSDPELGSPVSSTAKLGLEEAGDNAALLRLHALSDSLRRKYQIEARIPDPFPAYDLTKCTLFFRQEGSCPFP
jgi:hypothetical protein